MSEASLPDEIRWLLNDIGAFDQDRNTVANYLSVVDRPLIKKYIADTYGQTHDFTLQAVQIFEINRPGEAQKFRSDLGNSRLLFHGTQMMNIYGILCEGLRINRVGNFQMFGNGIYFSDCSTKAGSYSTSIRNSIGQNRMDVFPRKHGYLFVCEVALGRMKKLLNSDNNAHVLMNETYSSVLGRGKYVPDETKAQYDQDGVMIHSGPLELTALNGLQYNEFIVYNRDQIKLRYLVKVEFHPFTNNKIVFQPGSTIIQIKNDRDSFAESSKNSRHRLRKSNKLQKKPTTYIFSGDSHNSIIFGNYPEGSTFIFTDRSINSIDYYRYCKRSDNYTFVFMGNSTNVIKNSSTAPMKDTAAFIFSGNSQNVFDNYFQKEKCSFVFNENSKTTFNTYSKVVDDTFVRNGNSQVKIKHFKKRKGMYADDSSDSDHPNDSEKCEVPSLSDLFPTFLVLFVNRIYSIIF